MMKMLAILALVGTVCAQTAFQGRADLSRFQGKYVYDLLKPALNSAEVQAIEASRGANAYPTYNSIPQTRFNCNSKAGPGFYADPEAQCQVFHRCDPNGNQTDYLCVNITVFNQITLICDKWYNVDCGRSLELENFANSRLYTNQPLFDTPPAGYIAPSQQIASTVNVAQQQSGGRKGVSASGKATSSGRSDDQNQQQAGGQQQSADNSGSGDSGADSSAPQSSADNSAPQQASS